jgi:hypothetical protein
MNAIPLHPFGWANAQGGGFNPEFVLDEKTNSGAFSLTRKPGCPFQTRLFALVAHATGLLAPLQATTCQRSKRDVFRYAAGTFPCGNNHGFYAKDTP